MLWLLLLLAITLIYFYFKNNFQTYWKKKGVNHDTPSMFTMFIPKPINERILYLYKKFPDQRYYGSYQFTAPVLIVKDPELIKEITVKEFDSFLDHRSFVPEDVDPFWHKTLLQAKGERWRDLRTTLSPSFTSSKMKMMFGLIDECAKNFQKYFEDQVKSGEVIELEAKDVLTRYTNDVIATTAFGLKIDSLKDKNNDFYLMGRDTTDFSGLKGLKFLIPTLSPTLAKLINVKLISDKTKNYFSEIIKNTIDTREKNHIVRPDMIHLLLEAQKGRLKHDEVVHVDDGFSSVSESSAVQTNKKRPITMDDIISQAFIFFFAGFETVSTAMSFTFYELACNPEIQTRLRNELLEIEGEITYEKILGIKYLDMVVSELLRLWTPTIISDRKVTKPYTIKPVKPDEKPVDLPVGMDCWLLTSAIHRDPKYFPDPDKFDPERFNDENKHKINPATYLPFGAGPRNCIGSRFALLEMKLLIYYTIKSFEIVPIEKTPIPMVVDSFTLNPRGGMWLGFKKLST